MTQTISWVVAVVVLWGFGVASVGSPWPAWPVALWKGFWIGAFTGLGILVVLRIAASVGMLAWMFYGALYTLLTGGHVEQCPPLPG